MGRSRLNDSNASAPRRGLFRRRFDERWLLDVVAAVARTADPKAPGRVTQASYNAARAASPFPDAPAAQPTATLLKRSWPQALKAALEYNANEKSHLASRLKIVARRPELDESEVRAALLTIALRLGKKGKPKAGLSMMEYTAERRRLLARMKRRHGYQPGIATLPTAKRIMHATGGWKNALAIADLSLIRQAPKLRGVPAADVIELCLEMHGALPTKPELLRFARANDISISRLEDNGKRYLDRIAELRARRTAAGKWTPESPPPRRQRPDYSRPITVPASFRNSGQRRRRYNWTREQVVAAFVSLLIELDGEHPTAVRYNELSRGRLDLPSNTTIEKFGPFSELREEAKAEWIKLRRPAS